MNDSPLDGLKEHYFEMATRYSIDREELFSTLESVANWQPFSPSVREELEQRKQLTEWCAW